MFSRVAMAQVLLLLAITACSDKSDCDAGLQRYDVYLYRTPEQSYAFFKGSPKKIMGYDIVGDNGLTSRLDRVFSSYYGRSVGVEAIVCGKVETVDFALSPYDRSLVIHKAIILRHVDVTNMIDQYMKDLGYPGS